MELELFESWVSSARSVLVGDGLESSIKTVNEINKVIGSVE